MSLTDPTLNLLRQLQDPSLWVVVPNVPIFRPHKRRGDNGKTIEVDEGTLKRIVENYQRAIRDAGVVPRITLGHVLKDPKTPESQQPDIVGFAPRWRVGSFGPEGKPAILTDFYFRRERYEECKQYPYRSAEFYAPADEITGIALLRRDPELDLGLLTYARESNWLAYAQETAMPDPTTPPSADDKTKDTAEEEHHYARFASHMKRYMAECGGAPAIPSGSNTGIPKPEDKSVTTYQRDPAEAVRYARLEAEQQRLAKENDALRLDYARADAKERVARLVDVDGYFVKDRAAEVERMAKLTTAERDARELEIRENYSRDPAHGSLIPVLDQPDKAGDPTVPGRDWNAGGEARFGEAVQYMREHKCTIEEATAKLTAANGTPAGAAK